MWQFVHAIKKTKVRTSHIAALNRNGKIMGYVSIMATKKLVEWVQKNYPPKSLTAPNFPGNFDFLRREKFVIVRIRPMPGYKFEKWKFVKK